MKVAVAGGGPAGLYFALLVATAGGHQVKVFERNPEGATYGWGVVFSEGTLANLAGDHQGLIEDLDRLLIRWSTISIHRPEGTVRVAGQPFTALNRRRTARCAEPRGPRSRSRGQARKRFSAR